MDSDSFPSCIGAVLPCTPTGLFTSQWDTETQPQIPRLKTDKFVPQAGQTLIQADITVSALAGGFLRVENRDPLNSCPNSLTLDIDLQIEPVVAIAGIGAVNLSLQDASVVQLGAFDGSVNFMGASGATVAVNPVTDTRCFRITDAGLLALLTDTIPGDAITEQVEWKHRANDSSSSTGCAPQTFQSDPEAKVSVTITYKVCSVVLADCDNDGIPDATEITNGTQIDLYNGDGPDFCVPNGIPDDCEAFQDCDNDNIPDVCDTDTSTCVCRCVNRQNCGSLLLYPEFDSRRGKKTLVTITNSCCDDLEGNVTVEFRWINKLNCQETNRSFALTPCDTLTFYSDAVDPNQRQGYLYAFARRNGLEQPGSPNPLGSPIVFNHLIGQELVFDGISANSYALNAVSFLGLGNSGATNDDDNDGIRDLNGPGSDLPEYEEAPDKILIPRFLGQDEPSGAQNNFAPDIFHSELILIALSGGAQFETTVFAEIYNDNEVAFSQEHNFTCWEKLKLRDFSSWTLESSLDSSDNDLQEIGGASHRESGWIRLDGLSASSGQETIVNPAIYAVLVEKTGAFAVADLPWEECAQNNGDLLPLALFGDGPNPQDGDNQ